MKTIYTLIILVILCSGLQSQNIQFYKKSGVMITIALNEVDNIWFTQNPNAINIKKTDNSTLSFQFAELDSTIFGEPKTSTETVNDIDGNTYATVTIGTQVWMAENLKVTKYNDGIAIPLVTDNSAWSTLSTPGYCWYNNDQTTYGNTYGALYNWYTVNTSKLCPIGWHMPTDAEWTTLTTYLGGESVSGGKLKEIGTTHWTSPNTYATNETGFTALPGGYRYIKITGFMENGKTGIWWSATEDDMSWALSRHMSSNASYASKVYKVYNTKQSGFSVRCLKD